MEFFGITLPQFSITAFLVVLATAATSLWWHRSLQKKQIKFEKSKMFAEEKRDLFSDFLLFYKTMKKVMESQRDKEKEIAGEQLSKVVEGQLSKASESQLSEMIKLASDITNNVRIYGDADLIDALNGYMRETTSLMKSKSEDANGNPAIRAEERLFRAFRKNMGHDDSKLCPGSIVAINALDPGQHPHNTGNQQDAIFYACKGQKYKWLNDD